MKSKHKQTLFALLVCFGLLFWLVGPSGTFSVQEQAVVGGTQVLLNPDLQGQHDGWGEGCWSSASHYPTDGQFQVYDGYTRMFQSGYDNSFYAVSIGQGSGPTAFYWAERQTPYVSVNGSYRNLVCWSGSMDDYNVSAVSCLGMGVDFWFDAVTPNGENKPVEMYVFFFMAGAYALPVGSYKHVVRQDYNFTSKAMGFGWDYLYFHHSQDNLGEKTVHSFDLYDYVKRYKQALPEYQDAEFFLTKVDCCMELFMSYGIFTVDYIGIEQSPL